MKRTSFYSFILILFSNISYAQFQTILSDSANAWFSNIHFLNNDTGFVLGAQFTPQYVGTVARTFDGGTTWHTTAFNYHNHGIHFLNDSVGFVAGQDQTIYRTSNTGWTWDFVSTTMFEHDIDGVYCISFDTVLFVSSNTAIKRTVDGGYNFHTVFDSLEGRDFPETCKIIFNDHSIGYVVQTTVAKTIDRGLNWSNLNIPSNMLARSAYFFDTDTGIIVGRKGKVSWTFDGGQVWSITDSIGPYALNDVHFVSDSIGFIAGGFHSYGQTGSKSALYKTMDRGTTWELIDSSYEYTLLKLAFPSDSIGYVVGFHGLILKIQNANSKNTSVSSVTPMVEGIRIFPNPCRTNLNVETREAADFKIVNMLGQVLRYGKLESGITTLNVSEITSGFYIVVSGNESLKFIKD